MKDQYLVKKIDRPVDWVVEVPGSKSMTNRALLMAALSDGRVDLDGVLFSEDSRHFLAALRALGSGMRVLDVCTGSGCILLSLLKLCAGLEGTGTDLSEKALQVAGENARHLLHGAGQGLRLGRCGRSSGSIHPGRSARICPNHKGTAEHPFHGYSAERFKF